MKSVLFWLIFIVITYAATPVHSYLYPSIAAPQCGDTFSGQYELVEHQVIEGNDWVRVRISEQSRKTVWILFEYGRMDVRFEE